MFKSVFAKYVTAFMTIITFGFAVLLLVMTAIVSRYSVQVKTELLDHVAQIIEESVSSESREVTPESFPSVFDSSYKDTLDRMVSVFTSGEDEKMTVWVADHTGKIFYTVDANDESNPTEDTGSIPEDLQKALRDEDGYSGTWDPKNGSPRLLVRASAIRNREGEICGMIAVCSSNLHFGFMLEDISKTVVVSALLVLLAALIAAYFITERTVYPLRRMRRAAREFASGNFDERVSVQGKDEVAELAVAFNQMADSLKTLETMRNSFIASVSHDLRTPMTTIAGFIDGIRDGVIPPDQQEHYLEIVSMEVHRLSRLVTQLLDLSRIEAGDRKFVMKNFDICEMARLILISLEKKIDEKHLDVEFLCEEDRMTVHADRDAIHQVLYNICHNAIKFSHEGGSLRIRIESSKDRKVTVSVRNEGQGIPEEDLPFVFERFYKGDKSRNLDKTGVGLGLFISKTIISAHDERIWVESEAGKSCEFFFTLQKPFLHLHRTSDTNHRTE